METISSNSDQHTNQIFLGDFIIHWNDSNDPILNIFKSFLSDLNRTQACNGPTHNRGSTLDLTITKDNVIQCESISPCDRSDHYLISFLILEKVLIR